MPTPLVASLDKRESDLREIIAAEESPVLGPSLERIRNRHRSLVADPVIEQIRSTLAAGSHGFRQLSGGLHRWPAIFVWLLTDTIARDYSSDNEYAVYPPIQHLLGRRSEFTAAEKEELWAEYRAACQHLGLAVTPKQSGTGYIVNEFLHQVGLPLCFVVRVTELMAKTAEAIGRPDEDDPDSIRQWQDYLLDCAAVHSLPKRARQSLEEDVTGFYVRLFLRAAEMPAVDANSIAGRMAAVLTESGRHLRRRGGSLRIPRLLLRNDELVVELPPGDAESWTIQVDGRSEQYRGEAAARIVPIMESLPKLVEVRNGSGSPYKFELWSDGLDNRLLIFDEDGRWRAAGQLNSASLTLAPGNYRLLLRFVPQGRPDEVECLQDEPSLYLWPVSLQPGETVKIRRGPALLEIHAEQRPWLGFDGDSLISADGRRIYLSHRLHVRTAGWSGAQEPVYEVCFTTGDQEIGVLPADTTLDLSPIAGKLSPALHRLVAELRPRGTQRAVARTAVLVWHGLEQRDSAGRLTCRQRPENLVETGCDNAVLERDATRIGPRDTTRQDFTLEFKMAQGRALSIRWPVPGVFLELEDYSAQPVERRRLPLDRLLPVTPSSRQVLRISSTLSGRLMLQSCVLRTVKAGRPVLQHLSPLCEALDGGEGTLAFAEEQRIPAGQPESAVRSSGALAPLVLARLTAPHEVRAFDLQRNPHEYRLQLAFAAPCSRLRICAQNLLTGEEVNETVLCDDPDGWNEHRRLRLESLPAKDGWVGCLTMHAAQWPAGIWTVHFDACLASRWGRPTNVRQDVFALGMLLPGDGSTVRDLNTLLNLVPLPGDTGTQLQVLTRVHKALLVCYAEPCWPDLKCLAQLWTRLLKSLPSGDDGILRSLIQISGLQPPESAPVSWLPLKNIVAERLPLLTRPCGAYGGLDASHGPLAAILGVMAQAEASLLAFLKTTIDLAFACGFGLLQLQAGRIPERFDGNEYRKAILSSERCDPALDGWQPGPGNFLGRAHYTMAWERMRQRYRDTLSGNDLRRSRALGLCKHIMRHQPALALCLNSNPIEEADSAVNERMLLGDIETFLSIMARACRREACEPGALAAFHALVKDWAKQNSSNTDEALSYMLGIGTELFAFYLLLWELVLTAERSPTEKFIQHA